MKFLTIEEHKQVVDRLISLLSSQKGIHHHEAGWVYTSLMVCFAMHSRGAAESILTLHNRFGDDWFPATTGYVIARSLFEIDVTAHYIALDPVVRSSRYIEYEHVIWKKRLLSVLRHRSSDKPSWREAMQLRYEHEFAERESEIEANYDRVRSVFEDRNGRQTRSWSGKSLLEMAREVDHSEAYDVFYAELSSFTHVNVMMANRFLRPKGLTEGDGPAWSMRADEFDVGNVFRYVATFLTCFLELLGKEFGLWDETRVRSCWDFPEANGRSPAGKHITKGNE